MRTQLHNQLNLASTATQLCLLLSCGILFTSVGCGIPGRRCAQPGNPTPVDYLWNNGSVFGKGSTVSQDQQNPATEATGEFEDADNVESNEDPAAPPRPKFEPSNLNRPGNDSATSRLAAPGSHVKPASFAEPIQDSPQEDVDDVEQEDSGYPRRFGS